MRPFYTIPLKPENIIKRQRHGLTEISQSVSQFIHLILKTHLTELRYDYYFGCYVWDQDFENIQSISRWEHEMESHIRTSVTTYEKRLRNPLVKIKVEEPSLDQLAQDIPNRFKRRINIEITGELWKVKQPFREQEFIYFSPLSIN